MQILVLFATNSGATGIVADQIAKNLTTAAHTVTVKNPLEIPFEQLQMSQIIVLASPSWDFGDLQGMPHQDFRTFFTNMEGKNLKGKKFAVVGLGDSSYSVFCGAADHLEEFVKKMQGELIVATLRLDGFYFDQAKNEQLVKEWTDKLVQILASIKS